ncbi:single stranded DNA-binding protein [Owenweeksia hongkongensis DSM 17368]|uniref:Single-stranded DNA-binding protein n=1 Tax=Owenweeksia hongkongensis (strain DSM 17368 / CIP 108786 / JCM 12287 / NRRL B-23963 / UST20020801) TaxID=926562 RepID=G8R207_OWEHD|nr:single-stranded DNA-binding protein [Owenweeksia hongkongensis]AEV33957.1 single stranded DNA-binding protein [Owenweeksia hongkongensis DSM 17368]
MAGSLNKVMLIGNLGKDPEVRTFEGGNMLARFPLATSESYTSRQTNEKVTQTEWHNVVCRRGLAEIAEKYLHKGDKVYIEGRIKTRSWDDASGEKKYSTEIHADTMTMLGSPRDGQQNGGDSSTGGNKPANDFAKSGGDEDNDLPF